MSYQEEQDEMIAGAIARRLGERSASAKIADDHLDADTIAAFLEGQVAEPGATAITSHLVVCSDCRRASARVTHLEFAVSADEQSAASTELTGRLRQLIDDLAARVLPSSEADVVFAYEDRSTEPNSTDETPQGNSPTESEPEKRRDS